MSYYLTDPYYYLPKSYPFLSDKLTYPQRLSSNRPSSLGRHIESGSVIRRQEVSNKCYEDSARCEHKLLRCKFLQNEENNAQNLSAVVSYRRSRESSLRKTAHKFPNFVSSKDIIEEIKRRSQHAQAI